MGYIWGRSHAAGPHTPGPEGRRTPGVFYAQQLAWRGWSGDGGAGGRWIPKVLELLSEVRQVSGHGKYFSVDFQQTAIR